MFLIWLSQDMELNLNFRSFMLILMIWGCQICGCYGYGTFGFDIHHRFSDSVKGILPVDDLPEKGSLDYYSVMAHRDCVFHGRRLASTSSNQTALTFADGNITYLISSLGYLHYANVTVGTPSLWFLVALDTGSDLFWLPCDCISCVTALIRNKERFDLNMYSPNASSTSAKVPCNSTLCSHRNTCSAAKNMCPYHVEYLSKDTASSGYLVEDVLHLITDDSASKAVDTQITFGCGKIQTGSFLDGAAPNGLFGLGMANISVPSILASKGFAANSFSLCFGEDGIGRISFGDKGSSDQGETPFVSNQTYSVSMTKVTVGNNVSYANFSAIFDSGTSFTYLNDPAYTVIAESFDSQAGFNRHASDSSIPFDYCYDVSFSETIVYPQVILTMHGGDQFNVTEPTIPVETQTANLSCLAILKSGDVNIIGQNFMIGKRIVFDREKAALGWKESNCYDTVEYNTVPVSLRGSSAVSPATAVDPQATENPNSGASPPQSNRSPFLNPFSCALTVLLLSVLAIV